MPLSKLILVPSKGKSHKTTYTRAYPTKSLFIFFSLSSYLSYLHGSHVQKQGMVKEGEVALVLTISKSEKCKPKNR